MSAAATHYPAAAGVAWPVGPWRRPYVSIFVRPLPLELVWRRWLYVFDRELRLAVVDAVERIEIAFRAQLSQTMSKQHGPHWFTHAQHFVPGFRHAQFVARVKVCDHCQGVRPRWPRAGVVVARAV